MIFSDRLPAIDVGEPALLRKMSFSGYNGPCSSSGRGNVKYIAMPGTFENGSLAHYLMESKIFQQLHCACIEGQPISFGELFENLGSTRRMQLSGDACFAGWSSTVQLHEHIRENLDSLLSLALQAKMFTLEKQQQ
jgi:hypothetical protein